MVFLVAQRLVSAGLISFLTTLQVSLEGYLLLSTSITGRYSPYSFLRLWNETSQGWISHCSLLIAASRVFSICWSFSSFPYTNVSLAIPVSPSNWPNTVSMSPLPAGQSKRKSIPPKFSPRSAKGAEPTASFLNTHLLITTSCIRNIEVHRADDLKYCAIFSPSVVCITFHGSIQIPWVAAYHGCAYNWVDRWCEFHFVLHWLIPRPVNLSISLCMQLVGGQALVLMGAVLEGYSRLFLCCKIVRGTNQFL